MGELLFREEVSKEIEKSLHEDFDSFLRKKGIDLISLYEDVRKIVISGFSKKVSSEDLEDIIQEIYKGILIRNNGICPFDATKSSFGSYVYMVSNCIIANYYQKKRKHPYLQEIKEDFSKTQRPMSLSIDLAKEKLEDYIFSRIERNSQNEEVWNRLLQGYKLSEISRELKISTSRVSKILRTLKATCARWAQMEGMESFLPLKFQSQISQMN
jgi:RNA polymerase sigma factor (sigma-70 family)